MTSPLGETFFRHASGRIVSLLSRRVGVRNLDAVEDAVQRALLAAVETWRQNGPPENALAWLYRVAHNQLAGELRRSKRRGDIVESHARDGITAEDAAAAVFLAGDVPDDLLRMLFVCCDDALPVESQLVLALRVLCGFGIHEIAERLFTSEANVYKRLGRARTRLRDLQIEFDDLTAPQLGERLGAVQAILYVMFTEGYLSSDTDGPIRRDLCDEARRLATVLAEHPVSATPETFALLALMHLHTARLPARQDGSGGLLLLEEQDRSLWNQDDIGVGLHWLARSADGDGFSRYHAEAGIAAEHCLATSFAATRWPRIVSCYELLERLAPSVLHTLNRAVAVAEWRGPARGLALLEGLAPPSWLAGSHLWSAVLADLHRRCGHDELARGYRDAAIAAAPSLAVKHALSRRLGGD